MKAEDRNIIKRLVHQFDLMNTINGGISKTSVQVLKSESKTELKIAAPGVSPDAFNIFVNNNKLMVFSILKENQNEEALVTVPLFSKTWTLPPYIDDEQIEAFHENDTLKIVLPYKNDSRYNFRKIDIKYSF